MQYGHARRKRVNILLVLTIHFEFNFQQDSWLFDEVEPVLNKIVNAYGIAKLPEEGQEHEKGTRKKDITKKEHEKTSSRLFTILLSSTSLGAPTLLEILLKLMNSTMLNETSVLQWLAGKQINDFNSIFVLI